VDHLFGQARKPKRKEKGLLAQGGWDSRYWVNTIQGGIQGWKDHAANLKGQRRGEEKTGGSHRYVDGTRGASTKKRSLKTRGGREGTG